MKVRHPEDKIKILSQELVHTEDHAAVQAISAELRQAIHEHLESLRRRLGQVLRALTAIDSLDRATWR